MAFFMFTFICGSMISFAMEGGSGVAATTLTAQNDASPGYQNLEDDDTTIAVVSVSGFLPGGDRLTIGKESVKYNGVNSSTSLIDGRVCPCLTSVTRGYMDFTGEPTKAEVHQGPTVSTPGGPSIKGAKIYNRGSSIVNTAIGFNVADSLSTVGKIKTAVTVPNALIKMVVKLVAWDFAFLEGNFAYFKYIFLYPISAGFVWTMWTMGAGMAMSVFKR